MSDKILWKDKKMSIANQAQTVLAMIAMIFLPLTTMLFGSFSEIKYFLLLFYSVTGANFLFLGTQMIYEEQKWLYFNQHGLVMRWVPETGKSHFMEPWEKIKRINVISSWAPKNFLKWRRVKNNLSPLLFFAGAFYEHVMIFETKTDKLYFIGVNDYEGFSKKIKEASALNPNLKNLPILI
ncbi:MAG: hypothetical protein KKF44_08105 [Nanoarchaeota archaeon]|nr:hypothetical protein [Nanoarchaeota archaeon]